MLCLFLSASSAANQTVKECNSRSKHHQCISHQIIVITGIYILFVSVGELDCLDQSGILQSTQIAVTVIYYLEGDFMDLCIIGDIRSFRQHRIILCIEKKQATP